MYFLDLSENQIRILPENFDLLWRLRFIGLDVNRFRHFPESLTRLLELKDISINENPIETPPEIVSQGMGAIRNYYQDLYQGKVKSYEAKLILVGNGRIGKTSLSKRLIEGSFDAEEISTHGIRIIPWNLSISDESDEKSDEKTLQVNLWDFGGQEIYYRTIFLCQRI